MEVQLWLDLEPSYWANHRLTSKSILYNFKNRTIGPWLIWHQCEIRRISCTWNPADFMVESSGFHGHEIWWISWNLADFMVMKSSGFHGGIWWISWSWNLADFMESSGFHGHEIWQISWNPVDFMVMKSGRFHLVHPYHWMLNIQCISVFQLNANYAVYLVEIQKYTGYLAFSGRPWNPADFMTMKSARFHLVHPYQCISWNTLHI